LILLSISYVTLFSYGQDIHFAQFYSQPLLQNPAQAGYSLCNYRGGITHRNQWASFTQSFITQAGFLDMRLKFDKHRNDWFGAGVSFYSDIAGDSKLKTTKPMVYGSYYKGLNGENSLFFSLGAGIGFGNRSIDVSGLTFERQWAGDYFDSNRGNGEVLINQSITYPDFNGGILLSYFPWSYGDYYVGASLSHINRPKYSFYDNDTRLSRKINLHGGALYRATHFVYFKPEFCYTNQGNASELLFGTNMINKVGRLHVVGGLWMRTLIVRDIIPTFGLEMNHLVFLLSYEVNVSNLNAASQHKGGWEITLRKSAFCSKSRTKFSIRDSGSIPCAPF